MSSRSGGQRTSPRRKRPRRTQRHRQLDIVSLTGTLLSAVGVILGLIGLTGPGDSATSNPRWLLLSLALLAFAITFLLFWLPRTWRRWFQPNQRTARRVFPVLASDFSRQIHLQQRKRGDLARSVRVPVPVIWLTPRFVPKAAILHRLEKRLLLPRGYFESGKPYDYGDEMVRARIKFFDDLGVSSWGKIDLETINEVARKEALEVLERQIDGSLPAANEESP